MCSRDDDPTTHDETDALIAAALGPSPSFGSVTLAIERNAARLRNAGPHPFRHPWPRNDRCTVCGEYEEDGPHIAMAVHHIDGNAANNDPANLRLVPIAEH